VIHYQRDGLTRTPTHEHKLSHTQTKRWRAQSGMMEGWGLNGHANTGATHTHTHTHTSRNTRTRWYIHTHAHEHVGASTRARTYLHPQAHKHQEHVDIHAHAPAGTCTHSKYIHTHMQVHHTCTRASTHERVDVQAHAHEVTCTRARTSTATLVGTRTRTRRYMHTITPADEYT
jgi:hypothetical protein